MPGPVTDRINQMSDEEIRALAPDQRAALLAEAKREAEAPETDRLLGIGPDLNAMQEALSPIEEGTPAAITLPGLGAITGEPARVGTNAMLNLASFPVEALKMINSPIDALHEGGTLLEGAINKYATGPAIQQLAGIDPETDPAIQKLDQAGRGLKAMFTDLEQLKRRPLDPLALLGGLLVPAGRGLGLLPKHRAAGAPAALTRLAEDPGMASLAELFKGGKQAVGAGARAALEARPRPLKNLRERAGLPGDVGPQTLRTAADEALGFTASTGPLVQRIIREAPAKGRSRIIEAYSGDVLEDPYLPPGTKTRRAQEKLIQQAAKGADKIKEQVSAFQDEASEALAPHMGTGVEEVALEALKKDAVSNARKFNAKVSNEFAIEIIEPKLTQVASQRGTTPSALFRGAAADEAAQFPAGTRIQGGPKELAVRGRTGEATIGFASFPDKDATQISSQGRGQAMVKDFHQRLINAPPTTMGALQRFMWEIDDAIGITDTEVGKQANRSLVGLRNEIRQTLSDQLGEVYDTATRQYERDMATLSNMQIELGIEPGMLTGEGVIRSADRGAVIRRIVGAMDDADELAYGTLLELEKRGGVRYLPEKVAGVATQGLLGKGLVARSEVAQTFRGAGAFVKGSPRVLMALGSAGSVGLVTGMVFSPIIGVAAGIGGLMGSVVFSPKLMQRIILEIHDPATKTKVKEFFASTRSRMEAASRKGIPVSNWIQESITLEQMHERLDQAEESATQRSTLSTLSTIPLARRER